MKKAGSMVNAGGGLKANAGGGLKANAGERIEGERQRRIESLCDLTLSDILALSITAQQAGQTEEEFCAGLEAYKDSPKKTVNA